MILSFLYSRWYYWGKYVKWCGYNHKMQREASSIQNTRYERLPFNYFKIIKITKTKVANQFISLCV